MEDDLYLKDPQKFTRPINVAAPVGNLNISAKYLLEQIDSTSLFVVDDEGLIHFQMDTAFSAAWDDLIVFNNLTTKNTYDINPTTKTPVGPFVDTMIVNQISIGEDNPRFDSLTIDNALLSVSVTLPENFEGSFVITMPEVFLANGQPVSFTSNFSDASAIEPAVIDGGKILFQNLDEKSFFTIITEVDVTNVTGSPANTEMQVEIEMITLKPSEVFGYFGKTNVFEQKQEQEFDFFTAFDFTELVQFKDITIDITIDNYFGIPLGLYIDSMVFENTEKGTMEQIAIDGNSIEVDPAIYGNPVEPSFNNILINSDNSNLIDGINLGPNHFYVEIRGTVNPNGETTQNFINTNTLIEGDVLIDIPFWFKTSLYQRTDSMGFDFAGLFSDSTQVDMVEEVNLEFIFVNGFPFNIQAQIYMANDYGQIIDSLFDVNEGVYFWESALVDSEDKVTEPTSTTVNIQLLNEKAKKLYDGNATQILIKSSVSTGDKENPDFVKLYEDYSIEAQLKFEVKSGELNL
jgi:hypothetical protein